MNYLKEACERMVAAGQAKRIGPGFQITTPIDMGKVQQVEQSYAEAFDARVEKREQKERDAAIKLRGKIFY